MKATASIKVIRTIKEMRAFSLAARKKGKKIALVPTMGGIHQGHIGLVRTAKRRADVIVASIFINPAQFGPREDLSDYPRDLEGDREKLAAAGVHVIFAPDNKEIYPHGYRTYVQVDDLSQRLCGRSRPTHFRGVATIVLKLLNVVQPHLAVFGGKDYQQLVILRRMVRDLNLEVQVVESPIVRDKDGLALSSRNQYLSEAERPAALALHQAIEVAETLILKGERSSAKIISNLREVIRSRAGVDIEYIAICHPETLSDLESVEVKTVIALAGRVGRTRLIDNYYVDLVALQKKQQREKEKKAEKKAEKKPATKAAKKPAKTGKAAKKKK